MTTSSVIRISAVTLCLLVGLSPDPAFAYLDPGTGSALIQGIIAAIAAVGLTLKVYWHRVLGFLGLRKSSETDETTKDDPET